MNEDMQFLPDINPKSAMDLFTGSASITTSRFVSTSTPVKSLNSLTGEDGFRIVWDPSFRDGVFKRRHYADPRKSLINP